MELNTLSCLREHFQRRIPGFTLPENADPSSLLAKVIGGCASTPDNELSNTASQFTEVVPKVWSSCYEVEAPAGTAFMELISAEVDGVRCYFHSSSWNMPGLLNSDLNNIIASLMSTGVCNERVRESPYWSRPKEGDLGFYILASTQRDQVWVETSEGGRSMAVRLCGDTIGHVHIRAESAPAAENHCKCDRPRQLTGGCCGGCGGKRNH